MDNAYHGHTNSLIDLSPYKFNSKGGEGKKDYVHVLRMPDEIRGKWTKQNNKWINKYIDEAKEIINKNFNKKNSLSCFFFESILGCGGQIELPKGYLKNIVKLVRQKNALCIADEVQTGFGRVGSNFWAFEEHGIVPDIVTLGKPMGNGHPVSALLTHRKIVDALDEAYEGSAYFNTFGGNPVSAAAALAVLDILEEDKLIDQAKSVGKYLKSELEQALKGVECVKEIRGKGLFLGIELNEPSIAAETMENMMKEGVLVGKTGPKNNVIKLRPPMTFNSKHADFLVNKLSLCLEKTN